MKKLLSLVLALVMMLGCVALADDITGNWYGDLFGIPVTMTLNADGTYSMEIMGEVQNGVWVLEGDTMTMDKDTDMETPMTYDAAAATLTMDMDGMVCVFGREAVEAFVPAEQKLDAAIEEFAGSWEAANVYFLDMLVPTDFAGMTMKLDIVGSTVTMTLNMGEETDDVATLEGVYADGVITLTIPADEMSDESVFVVKVLQDATLSCEFSMMDMPVIFYLNPVVAE